MDRSWVTKQLRFQSPEELGLCTVGTRRVLATSELLQGCYSDRAWKASTCLTGSPGRACFITDSRENGKSPSDQNILHLGAGSTGESKL